MPSNEQIIEAARKRLMPELIRTYADSRGTLASTHEVFFRDSVYISDQEAEVVVLEPKQEHTHDKDQCSLCMKLAVKQYETGYKDGVKYVERKPWAVTPEDVLSLQRKNHCGGDSYGIAMEFARLLNEHFSLQPAPEPDDVNLLPFDREALVRVIDDYLSDEKYVSPKGMALSLAYAIADRFAAPKGSA